MNTRLVCPTAHSIRADASRKWQMAVLGCGMELQANSGIGYIQFRVVAARDPDWVIIGLAPVDASVADNQYPGKSGSAGRGGWGGDGKVHWTMTGPAPAENSVFFGLNDRVIMVLDCRADKPCVRLLVNDIPRLVHPLEVGTAQQPPLRPVVAIAGRSHVELVPIQALPPNWEAGAKPWTS